MSKIVKSIFNRPVHKDDIIPDLTFVQFVIYKYCIFQDKYHLGEKTLCLVFCCTGMTQCVEMTPNQTI